MDRVRVRQNFKMYVLIIYLIISILDSQPDLKALIQIFLRIIFKTIY
jgi:hypothetical protein